MKGWLQINLFAGLIAAAAARTHVTPAGLIPPVPGADQRILPPRPGYGSKGTAAHRRWRKRRAAGKAKS